MPAAIFSQRSYCPPLLPFGSRERLGRLVIVSGTKDASTKASVGRSLATSDLARPLALCLGRSNHWQRVAMQSRKLCRTALPVWSALRNIYPRASALRDIRGHPCLPIWHTTALFARKALQCSGTRGPRMNGMAVILTLFVACCLLGGWKPRTLG